MNLVEEYVSKVFDEEGTEVISYLIVYITLYVTLYLALTYIVDHIKWFNTKVLTPEFPKYETKESS